jgi:hypothetical protein
MNPKYRIVHERICGADYRGIQKRFLFFFWISIPGFFSDDEVAIDYIKKRERVTYVEIEP